MEIKVLNSWLTLPEIKSQIISESTPQLAFVKSHKSDIQKEMGALKSIITGLTLNSVYDLMAGSGFSGRVFEYMGCKNLILNDLSKECYNSLLFNFSNSKVYNLSAENVPIQHKSDLLFCDFNNFSNKTYDIWLPILRYLVSKKAKYILFTDSTSYCFKFGSIKPKNHFNNLNNKLISDLNLYINKICIFGNASLLLCSNYKTNLEYVTYKPIFYSIEPYRGLF